MFRECVTYLSTPLDQLIINHFVIHLFKVISLAYYCKSKSLKFCMGFSLRISRMNCFREIKYHVNVLAVHCNNVTNAKSAKLNSNEITFMGKTAIYNTVRH